MNSPGIFFAGHYRYRTAGVLLGALLAAGFGGAALGYVILVGRKQPSWSWGAVGAAGFVGGIGAVLLFTGLRLFLLWIAGKVLELEISTEGVRYGAASHPWSEIRWIGGSTEDGRVQLRLKVNGGAAPDLPLLVDQPLTTDRYDALMQDLSRALRETHPHVAVG
jgi:hypothetical protein